MLDESTCVKCIYVFMCRNGRNWIMISILWGVLGERFVHDGRNFYFSWVRNLFLFFLSYWSSCLELYFFMMGFCVCVSEKSNVAYVFIVNVYCWSRLPEGGWLVADSEQTDCSEWLGEFGEVQKPFEHSAGGDRPLPPRPGHTWKISVCHGKPLHIE